MRVSTGRMPRMPRDWAISTFDRESSRRQSRHGLTGGITFWALMPTGQKSCFSLTMASCRLSGLLVLAVTAALVGADLESSNVTFDPCPSLQAPSGSLQLQSPIDLDLCAHSWKDTREPLKLTHFNTEPLSFEFTNTGSFLAASLTWDIDSHQVPQISGANLPGTFIPLRLTMMWGANGTAGSEHSVNGHFFAGEMRIQCINMRYSTIQEAVQHADGLAGIIVFLERPGEGPLAGTQQLMQLAPELADIREAGSSVKLTPPPSLKQLMPKHHNRYVTYHGSSTGQGACPTDITWVSVLTPWSVLDSELDKLRQLKAADGTPLESSTGRRQQQPLNGRELFTHGQVPACEEV